MKIGIMGGTFDPIHNGHLLLGQEAYKQFGLDEVWFMPNGKPPHKCLSRICANVNQRIKMVQIAISEYEEFHLEDYEANVSGIYYTCDTMEYFSKKYATHQFYFIIGADSLFAIESWMQPERIFATCVILAAYRNTINTKEEMDVQINHLLQKYNADIRLLDSSIIDVSSSELRHNIENGENISNLVPQKVEQYIKKTGLYRKECI